jgi:DNA-binding CsgD family transcriptional regulator
MDAKDLSKSRAPSVAAAVLTLSSRRGPGSSEHLSERDHAERELAAHLAVAESLASWESTESALGRLLGRLAEALDCGVGVLWVPRDERLRPRTFWQAAPGDLGEFKMMTLTSRLTSGVELPGQAWRQLEPSGRSTADGPGPPRRRAAIAAGFRGAIAFPAIWAEEVVAVIELLSPADPELTERLRRSLAAIGSVLGHFLAHRRGILEDPAITERQVEILELAARGLSRRQIAERLVVSPSTVKTHFENTYARLGVKNRAAAVAEAIRLGLVD